MPTNNSNTEAHDEHNLEGAQQGYYTKGVEACGDIQGYNKDHSYLCENLWAPFTSGQGFNLNLGLG